MDTSSVRVWTLGTRTRHYAPNRSTGVSHSRDALRFYVVIILYLTVVVQFNFKYYRNYTSLFASARFLKFSFHSPHDFQTKEKNFCQLRVRVAQYTRRRISSAPRTDEGFINRVTDKRVGRWDFRSFGSLSQPTAEIFFRFVLIFLPLKCSRHTRQ